MVCITTAPNRFLLQTIEIWLLFKIMSQLIQAFSQFLCLVGRRVPVGFDGGDRNITFEKRAHIVIFFVRLLRVHRREENDRFRRSGDSPSRLNVRRIFPDAGRPLSGAGEAPDN
jgi:hypothetical protein